MATTTNFGWTLATVGGDNNAWGSILNTLFQAIDTDLQTTLDVAEEALDGVTVLDDAGVLDAQTGLKLYLPYAAFVTKDDETDAVYGAGTDAYYRIDDGDATVYAPVILPPGVTITQVDLLCDKQSQTSVTVALIKVNASTGVVTSVGSGSRSATGVGNATISALSETVGASFYLLKVTSAGASFGQRIYGATITYTRHDLSEVL